MSALYESIGNAGYKNLLADPQGADIITVPLKPASGVIPAGTILYRASTGLYEPAASAQIVATNMLVVNKETVDATEAGVAEDAVAFRAGCFVDGAVTPVDGADDMKPLSVAVKELEEGVVKILPEEEEQ